ncbi:dienelactone hydrolase family protein [Nocardioides albus]|uniref:Carboxymethylenebutenolidase n=1 Tax=Nocardioides albus TaxID=1841 RepID=A0A7W5A2S9_9ACTN|nr:dienelactone hydrolase family protein [Nocardioides albus]MBB3088627.1 carboxymethylenebutenolidase [Nocardioides albus]GGU17570.1 carboxymethylenebutenolidase [Nocardioides albus]
MIDFAAPAGPAPGYHSVPEGDGPWPGVVVVQDVFGMTADIKRISDRFAANGYLTLTPALYRGRKPGCVVSTMKSLVTGQGTAVDDLIAARDHLAADPRCTGKVGVVGFCMGGGFSLLLAPRGIFDAAAPNYGQLPKNLSALSASCPMVASYGGKDRTLPGAADKIEAALAKGEVPRDVKVYPEAGHSFMNNWDLPGPVSLLERVVGFNYSEPEAEDAWRRILDFFAEHLGSPA